MADVCLILEGTYPYVTGGVSTWVHHLIESLPRVRFSLLTVLPNRDSYRDYRYEVPQNVVSVTDMYIHEHALSDHANRGSTRQAFEVLARFYAAIPDHDYSLLPEVDRLAINPATRVVSPQQLFLDRRTWDMVTKAYDDLGMEESFLDFYWTWRYSHLPLLRLADARIPPAQVYHTISTGYAGMLSALAHIRTGAPVLLTEHGIYANERRIEIEQARWIFERKVDSAVISGTVSPFKRIWITLFDHLSRVTYHNAAQIITLFENNRKLQVTGGADPARTRVIPNGIRLKDFPVRRGPHDPDEPFQVGFVGRVVSIKDVRTFIRACRIVYDHLPGTRFPIMGPTDEEPEYFAECQSLVAMLGLEDIVQFTGRVDVRAAYPKMDVVVLTSVSEAQPLVILEANICGVPIVATDVGACGELLNGRTSIDRSLGPSGLITPIANPEATAAAIVEILKDDDRRARMGQAGIKRVEQFYDEQDLNFAYLDLYRRLMTLSEHRTLAEVSPGARWRA